MSLYVDADELKNTLSLNGTSFVDDDIDRAIAAASRAIDGYKDRRFYPTTETRYYTADPYATSVAIDDLVSATSVTIDLDGDGVYETTWTEGTQFLLDPANAALQGRPYNQLVLMTAPSITTIGTQHDTLPVIVPRFMFPVYQRAIKIEGSFGWPAPPAQVKQAAFLIAHRLIVRTRSAPLGILVAAAADTVAAARLGRIDPDAAWLLDQIPEAQQRLLV